jgi:hypothetical protein
MAEFGSKCWSSRFGIVVSKSAGTGTAHKKLQGISPHSAEGSLPSDSVCSPIIHSKSQRVQAGLQFFMEEERLGHGDQPETWI